jgi:hypothetical protein
VMPFWNACRRRCRYLEKYGRKQVVMITVSNHNEPCRRRGILRNVAVGIGSSHHENRYKGKHVTPAPRRKKTIGSGGNPEHPSQRWNEGSQSTLCVEPL